MRCGRKLITDPIQSPARPWAGSSRSARANASAGLASVAPLAPPTTFPFTKSTSTRPILELMIMRSAPSASTVLISASSRLAPSTYLSKTARASLASR